MPLPLPVAELIPSPPSNGVHLGPLFVHFYGLMYVIGIGVCVALTRRRWQAAGGDPALVETVALWCVPAGIVGARVYSIVTTPEVMPPHWWGPLAIWDGGLGIWGGVAGGALMAAWRLRRDGVAVGAFADAVAPGLLLAQAIGRVGNYFNQELFGRPTTLPWALTISPAHRPPGYEAYATYQPSFLYELLADVAMALALIWIGHRFRIRAWGLFALYVAGYSGYRIFEESIRIDDAHHFLGLRVNFYVAALLCLSGLVWFALSQFRRPTAPPAEQPEQRLSTTR